MIRNRSDFVTDSAPMRGNLRFLTIFLALFVTVGCRFGTTQANGKETAIISNQGERKTQDASVPLVLPLRNPHIVVHKNDRKLELFSDATLVRTYKIGLGSNPVPDKRIEGDGATPEGEFYVFVKNSKSAYYLSLGISYPNIEDAERGLQEKLISNAQYKTIVAAIKKKQAPPQNTKLGGLIYIHGNGAGSDWTLGCIALDNANIRELYDAVEVGTPVTISH